MLRWIEPACERQTPVLQQGVTETLAQPSATASVLDLLQPSLHPELGLCSSMEHPHGLCLQVAPARASLCSQCASQWCELSGEGLESEHGCKASALQGEVRFPDS